MTIQEIRNQIDKILYYERLSPLPSSLDWTEKALVMASHQSGGSSHPIPDSVHKNNMRERLFRKYRLVDKLYDYAAIPSNVKQILENGRGFLNFLSHGDPTKWFFRDPPVNPVFSIEDVNTQQNPYLLPIIFSVACDVGQFSYNPCFAEAWLQQPGMRGAVRFWGSSAPQPWVEPIWADSVAIFSLTCDPGSIYFPRTLGKVTYWGVFSMLQHNFPQGAYTAKTWHLFGDASMEVRVGRQTRLLAEHSRFAIPGRTFLVFVVNTRDGLPCQYAVVCLWKENDNYISCKYTDRYGKVNFILPAELSPGRIYVTVSKLNTIPYEGIAEIIPTNVTCEKATYPNQGELFAIDPGNGNFHIVYNTGEDIVYRKSTDKGASWGDVIEIDSGSYPSLALDYSRMPRITYLKNDTVFCKTLNSDNTWHKTVVFGGDGNIKPGPPVITQTYLPEFTDYSYCIFPIKNLSEGTGKIYLSIFNVNEDIGSEPEEVVGGIGLKSPSIAITPGDIIHIV
ncbi:MAG: C25 family cysteine peptidase [candidate division WOR-3 bacterium]